jgi:hypothetical protein
MSPASPVKEAVEPVKSNNVIEKKPSFLSKLCCCFKKADKKEVKKQTVTAKKSSSK